MTLWVFLDFGELGDIDFRIRRADQTRAAVPDTEPKQVASRRQCDFTPAGETALQHLLVGFRVHGGFYRVAAHTDRFAFFVVSLHHAFHLGMFGPILAVLKH